MNAALGQAISRPRIALCYINHPFHHQHLSFPLPQAQPPVCPYMLNVEKILIVQSPGCVVKRLRSREAGKLTWCCTAGEDLNRDRRPLTTLESGAVFCPVPMPALRSVLQVGQSLYVQFKMNKGDQLLIVKGPQHRVSSFPVDPHSLSWHTFGNGK